MKQLIKKFKELHPIDRVVVIFGVVVILPAILLVIITII
jgi:hypothetical protein